MECRRFFVEGYESADVVCVDIDWQDGSFSSESLATCFVGTSLGTCEIDWMSGEAELRPLVAMLGAVEFGLRLLADILGVISTCMSPEMSA